MPEGWRLGPSRCSSARRANGPSWPTSSSRASRCSRSERGASRPPGILILGVVLLAAWLGIKAIKSSVAAAEFEQRIRDTILLNPTMPDEEMRQRLGEWAAKLGVRLDASQLRIERQGEGMGAVISRVQARYEYTVVLGWKRTRNAAVSP